MMHANLFLEVIYLPHIQDQPHQTFTRIGEDLLPIGVDLWPLVPSVTLALRVIDSFSIPN